MSALRDRGKEDAGEDQKHRKTEIGTRRSMPDNEPPDFIVHLFGCPLRMSAGVKDDQGNSRGRLCEIGRSTEMRKEAQRTL